MNISTLSLSVLAGLALALSPVAQADQASHHAAPNATAAPAARAAAVPAAPKLQAALRQLWHGHVVHTRDYAFAVQSGDDARARRSADAVVANAKQIADAVAGFYGKPAGERMLGLLAEHWGAVRAMTDARRADDRAAADRAMATMTANASEIATFLSGANPHLPADAVRGLLLAHGAHHASQIDQVMRGDLKGEQSTWKAMQAHMDTIADALAGAIAQQFPRKVS